MNVSVIAFNSIYIKYELRSLARQRAPNPIALSVHSELSVKVHLAFHLRPLDQESDARLRRAFAHIHTST